MDCQLFRLMICLEDLLLVLVKFVKYVQCCMDLQLKPEEHGRELAINDINEYACVGYNDPHQAIIRVFSLNSASF